MTEPRLEYEGTGAFMGIDPEIDHDEVPGPIRSPPHLARIDIQYCEMEQIAVTIIAGFRCQDGVVICADTQETSGSAKRNVPKLEFFKGPTISPEQNRLINHDLAIAIATLRTAEQPLHDTWCDGTPA